MNEMIIKIMALWLIYGFFGFIVETLYCSFGAGKFVQRGFLTGPIIPIYAFGALIILYVLAPVKSVLAVFFLGIVLTSLLEFIGSVIMEKIFDVKLWDYSKNFCNIHGRVCLKNSVLFGVLSVLLVFVINPEVMKVLNLMNTTVLNILVITLSLVTVIDLTASVVVTLHIRDHLMALATIMDTIKQNVSEEQIKEFLSLHGHKYYAIKHRIFDAYPAMSSEYLNNALDILKQHYSK